MIFAMQPMEMVILIIISKNRPLYFYYFTEQISENRYCHIITEKKRRTKPFVNWLIFVVEKHSVKANSPLT